MLCLLAFILNILTSFLTLIYRFRDFVKANCPWSYIVWQNQLACLILPICKSPNIIKLLHSATQAKRFEYVRCFFLVSTIRYSHEDYEFGKYSLTVET